MKNIAREIIMETINYYNVCKHYNKVSCGCGMVKKHSKQ